MAFECIVCRLTGSLRPVAPLKTGSVAVTRPFHAANEAEVKIKDYRNLAVGG